MSVSEREPIGVIGVGWVGLVTAACFADLGHQVVARDILQEKVDSLSRGEVPIYEPGLAEMLDKNRERLSFTTDMGEVLDHAELLFCCVDTPPTYSGDADLSRVETVVRELGDSTDHAIIMKSTVPVGTGKSIARSKHDLGYVSNPEFLKEGTAVSDFMKPDRVVVGANSASESFGDRVASLYEQLDAPIVRTDVASAEMIKLASNAFLATKISFINEIANVSEELGADVTEVARGMGLDARIGPQFLRAGIGWGGSCLVGEETVVIRRAGRTTLVPLEALWQRLEDDGLEVLDGMLEPDDLEVLSYVPGEGPPQFMPVLAVTRRPYKGEVVEIRTKMGRRVTCSLDHPWIVGTGRADDEPSIKFAAQLTEADWLPVAQGTSPGDEPALASVIAGVEAAGLEPQQVRVRLSAEQREVFGGLALAQRRAALDHPAGAGRRTVAIKQSGMVHLDEFARLGMRGRGARLGTATNGKYVKSEIEIDERFWRVVGVYLAEGHCSADGPHRSPRLSWSFHPTREGHLVDEVVSFWRRHGVEANVYDAPTAQQVQVSSRLVCGWWTKVLGLGRTSYEQRLPDLIWEQSPARKWALLSGLWEGDGSWSLIQGGPSVRLGWGTVSRELADGVMRLLGDLGIVPSLRVGRVAGSTVDTYWLTISGAEQVERAIQLVPVRDRVGVLTTISHQKKRTGPVGYRRLGSDGSAWLRVTGVERRHFEGSLYSLEVPGAHTFVTTGGLVTHNCFGKDVLSLKQLAGNSGYHFQLLTSVTEVNELQKRRTIGKLQKHLGSLVGKTIALLGIAFKPETDDIRDATSLVLAARLHGEGARVRAYDPQAAERAREVLVGTELCESALDAVDGADAVVLVTEWAEFAELDWDNEVKPRLNNPIVVDGRNFLDREALTAAGFIYEGIGR